MEQVDIIKQMVAKYPEDLMWATSASDIETAISQGKIASMIGVESGHAIGSSLAILRSLYELGVRYMTLTHGCNTPWADAAQVESDSFPPRSDGISEFGIKVGKWFEIFYIFEFEDCARDEQTWYAGGSVSRV